MFDILIKNARIIDGTGAPWFYGNLAIANGLVIGLGRVDGPARRVVDAAGRVVTPGFIDAHSHSDEAFLKNPQAESKVRQGVTAEVIGQCGSSAAPRKPGFTDDEAFSTFGEYLGLLEKRGVALNVIPLVGHGNIRQLVVGYDNRPATPEELSEMCRLTRESMEAGAFGFTTGLIYPPGCYASHIEIVEIAKVVAEYGGIYASHMREEGARVVESVRETIAVGEEAMLPVHISHHKTCGEANWGLVKDTLALVDAKRKEGYDITLDQYPYTATSTGLRVIIPQWAHSGGLEAMRQRLLDPKTRQVITEEILKTEKRWEWLLVSACNKVENKRFEGKTVQEIADITGNDPVNACLELLLDEDFNVGMVRFAMCEEDVEYVIKHPMVMIGSDASTRATYGPLSSGKPHPRAYGTFPRVLATFVRERKVLTLEEAVRKMTSLPAARFELWDRGILRPGAKADVVMFDPDTVEEGCTFANPHSYPVGIDMVIVNGTIVVEDGDHLGCLPGTILRKNRM